MERCDKHISAAVNQCATIEEAVCSVAATSRLYNEDLTQLDRIERVSGVGSCSRELREAS
jgi:hypothetical protein